MNVDRRLFLAMTAAIATASSAACTAEPETGADSHDVVAEGSAACLSEQEAAYPYEEGTCFDIAVKAQEDEYRYLTSPTREGATPAEMFGCTPWSNSHPVEEGAQLCDMYSFDFVYAMCRSYAFNYKRAFAREALSCLQSAGDLHDSGAVYDCGFDALDQACNFHSTTESTCRDIEAALAARGMAFDDHDQGLCLTRVGGLREHARAELVRQAAEDAWYGMHSAIEGLDEP
jgi:hypothetical protein